MNNSHSTQFNQDAAIYKAVHDIRSPIAVMNVSLSIIKKLIPSDNLEPMKNAVRTMNHIVDDLLEEHSEFKSKKMNKKINLFSLLDYAIRVKNYEWQKNPCKIILTANQKDQNLTIFANENGFSRMISNLLNNAYESLLDQKKDITIYLKTKNSKPLIIIKDSGRGIPKDKINFALNGNSTKLNGHGLGLSSALSYMKSIGGELFLNSIENEGTEIELVF